MMTLHNVWKTYTIDKSSLVALQNVSLNILQGETVAITGPSGSGKSTLLNMLGLIDEPDKGNIEFQNNIINNLSDLKKTEFRRDIIGYVFQKFHLVPVLTALENVALPALLQGKSNYISTQKAKKKLCDVGLEEFAHKQVKYLSGGQRQRVAIARALINNPPIILADEPTANLDSHSSRIVLDLLFELVKKDKHSLVIVTHDEKIANLTNRTVKILDGKLS